MATTSIKTGRTGRFTVTTDIEVARTTQWSVNPTLDTSTEWGDSDGDGYTLVAAGRRGCSFTAEGKYDTGGQDALDLFVVGDKPIAALFIDSGNLYWDFPCALCRDFSMLVDIDTEEVVGWTSEWKADGIFYYPGKSPNSRTYPS